ncbi:MAG: hypothetical protein D6717_01105 [Gammaproteobacteria bacterium]|nr:MAG: hypothetical protein D6717_01105 [Gammaproteobacteria bacterium]
MALWLISLIFVFVYTYKSYDKIIFKRWQDDVPVFFIYNNNPDRDSFHDFYSQLTEKIRKTRVNPKLSAPQKLEVYSKHLQFLVDEDVISPQEAKDIYERKRMRMDMEKSGITGIVPDKE